MSANSGIEGKVMMGANTVLNITDWSLDVKHKTNNITNFTEEWDTFVKGLKSATGSLKGQFNYADTNGQKALVDACLAGTPVALKLYYSTTGYYTIAEAYLEMKVSSKVSGIAEAEFSFTVSGAVTVV